MPMTTREFAVVCCPVPRCGGRLDLFQPHEAQPVLLGCCADCGAGFLIRDADAGGWEVLRLMPGSAADAALLAG